MFSIISRGDGSSDGNSQEVKVQKSVKIKGLSRGWTAWIEILPLVFLLFIIYGNKSTV